MASSIKSSCNVLNPIKTSVELGKILGDMQMDISNLRAAFLLLTAKLDTNHGAASDHAATLNPAALNATA